MIDAGQAKLSAIWLMAAIYSSTAVIIYCLNVLKAERKGFLIAYKNINLEKRKMTRSICGQ